MIKSLQQAEAGLDDNCWRNQDSKNTPLKVSAGTNRLAHVVSIFHVRKTERIETVFQDSGPTGGTGPRHR